MPWDDFHVRAVCLVVWEKGEIWRASEAFERVETWSVWETFEDSASCSGLEKLDASLVDLG